MSHNEASEQVVTLTLKGIEVAAKISGEGAKNLAVYLYAVLTDQKKTKGKTRLTSMLKSGKELKIFAVKTADLPIFVREAKKYGILYAALRDKKNIDGMCDVMVRAEDGAKINRIIERFGFATVDMADIKTEILKDRQSDLSEKKNSGKTPKTPSEPSLQDSSPLSKKDSVRSEIIKIQSERVHTSVKNVKKGAVR